MNESREQVHRRNRQIFAILAIILEILMIVMYARYVRVTSHTDATLNSNFYPMYQDVNVMMLIGFGFLMAFIKRHSLSALSYTFLINVIVVQLYILLSAFWSRVFNSVSWDVVQLGVTEKTFTGASYSVASILIAFGAILGRVGPLELLIISIIGSIGYTLNEHLVYETLHVRDVGGSTAIHTYGAYFGLAISIMLARKKPPRRNTETSYVNSTFAMIGTLFLWMFWPSFNAGFFPENGFQRSLIITNTVLSLTGSCLATFFTSAIFRDKFAMDDILNATLAGGVIIGASSGVVVNPGLALSIGVIGGIVSTLGFIYLSKWLQSKGLHDTCGVNNLHGIPGLLGGIISGIVIGGYTNGSGIPDSYSSLLSVKQDNWSFYRQGGVQVAAAFISLGIAVVLGIFTGLLISCFYKFDNEDFFQDHPYFEIPDEEERNTHDDNQDQPIGSQNALAVNIN